MDKEEVSMLLKKEKTLNLASMRRRLGAYLIDYIVGSLVCMFLLYLLIPSYGGVMTGTTAVQVASKQTDIYKEETAYKERITYNKNDNIKKIELFNNDKRIFKGDKTEYNNFLKENKISNITAHETVKSMQGNIGRNIFITFIYISLMMQLGLFNIITFFELWLFKGYTLGKWLMKIRVVQKNGERITAWQAVLRDVFIKMIANGMTWGILNVISFIWGCISPECKTIHDMAAHTEVINIQREVELLV